MDIILQATQLLEKNHAKEAIHLIKSHLSELNDEEKRICADFFMQWGFLDEAMAILHDLRKIDPEDSELKLMLAEIYTEDENDREAMELLLQINENDEAYLPALIQLADLYEAQGLFEVAEQKLLQAKRLAPEEEIIDFALGELLYSVGEFNRAIMYYEKVSVDINGVSTRERLANCFASIGKYEEAIQNFQAIEKPNTDTQFKYGLTAYYADRLDIAISVWKELLMKDPYYHSSYKLLAQAYEEKGMIQEAYETAMKGISYDEFNKELYYYTGILAQKLNDLAKSEAMFRQAISLDPDYKHAILSLVKLFKEKEKPEFVVDLLTSIKETKSEDPLYDWELARAYRELEQFDDALKYFQDAYTNMKDDSDFLKEYGYFLMEEGRNTEAIDIFTKYLTLIPDDFEIVAYKERLLDM